MLKALGYVVLALCKRSIASTIGYSNLKLVKNKKNVCYSLHSPDVHLNIQVSKYSQN